MMFQRSTRFVGVVAVSALAALGLTSCSGDGNGGDASASTITVALANHTWTTALEERLADFEAASGISVNVTAYGEDQLSDQYQVKLNAGSDEFDVLMFRPLEEGRSFVKNDWLAPLDERVSSNPDWNWSDFQPGPVDAVSIDGAVYGVPIVTEREVIFYRADLLQKAGLAVPATMKEFEAAVAVLNDPKNGVYGFVARGARNASVSQFSSYLYSFGGDWDAEGQSLLGNPEAVEAYKFYSGLLNKYGPPGSTNMSWPEAVAIFAQGKAAFYTDADAIYNNLTDPSKSVVGDTVGFAQFPAGPAGSKPYNIASWALGTNSFSAKKAAAWTFIEWATSPDVTLDIQSSGVPMARSSVWDNPAGVAGFPAQLVDVIKSSAERGIGYNRPRVVQVGKARDIIGLPIATGIEGGDVAAAAAKAQTDYQAFLDGENK
jgi:multiple sugar transport system substrate-binding protein